MARAAIAISYCTTCKGRMYQLRETLPVNLSTLRDDEELVVVDYASPDGLAEWIWAEHKPAIEAGRLRFFEVLDDAPWHMAKAKNLAHRLARGDYLFNLDADNFILPADTRLVRTARREGIGIRQKTRVLTDGTPGRVGMPRAVFHDIGGYDESFIGLTFEDYDIGVRAEAAGYRFAAVGAPARLPIQNDRTERLAQYVDARPSAHEDVDRILQLNLALHQLRMELQGYRRRQNFATFRGRLNGVEVILDGLGHLRSPPTQGSSL